MDSKASRQKALRQVIQEARCEDQQTLVELLMQKGIATTQAVISRDLKELGVIKKSDEAGRYYALIDNDLEKELLQRAVLGVAHNQVMIVVHTRAGMAAFVGDLLDASSLPLLGCISGENVVFVAPSDIQQIKQVVTLIEEFLCVKK